jgi:hypothetical protein
MSPCLIVLAAPVIHIQGYKLVTSGIPIDRIKCLVADIQIGTIPE